MRTDAADGATLRVALFPLHVVLFPGGILPLRIFEPRYVRMVSECMREQRPFAVAVIVAGPEVGGVAATAGRGTLAHIVDFEQGDDGLLQLVCDGGRRVRIGAVEAEPDQLLRAEVSLLPETAPQSLPDDLAWMAELLDQVLTRVGEPYGRLRGAEPTADHVAARLIELLPLPLAEKQALFDEPDALRRAYRLAGLINPHGEEVSVV
ncbi:MAG: LON peptidase substrate-binding domain-containing protein [Chromatiaceae bacterium]|nr:LON peptidase substrate-binding domain-containing protein [Gammaproteobacteria bacterium]MCP5299958.1 LON peptidase substrate-binding domain-containing protein [Chromatiaceae bacterium]MCP5422032.1 LON peptidase substrate-binding domain-containing protein [Chromatiaceae bacterium]